MCVNQSHFLGNRTFSDLSGQPQEIKMVEVIQTIFSGFSSEVRFSESTTEKPEVPDWPIHVFSTASACW